ncbi:MAG TPA: methyltransferase domain-containing protein [Blastocatellia bacterium]|nr:methyltransferase domain-containing protein [Blastocatellia bacterium]
MMSRRLQNTPLVSRLIEKNDARHFYSELLRKLIANGTLSRDMSVLVVCGTVKDKSIFEEVGFTNVTISNLDTRTAGAEFLPYAWSYQDAEALTFPDKHFDCVVVNAGLHHCRSPHRGLLEMYRVARRAILIIEARESLLLRVALKMGLAEQYEVCNVVTEGLEHGGVRNTLIPNYVYRWTEREVEKTIASYAPHVKHQISFYYELRFPFIALVDRHPIFMLTSMMLYPLARLTGKIFPKQSNLFAFCVKKPDLSRELLPWLKLEGDDVALNMSWIRKRYDVSKNNQPD